MHARSALFDLYGDHLLDRGGWAPIASAVGLLGSLEISAPAVRTAVSRMVREGWLEPVERAGARGYAVTARGRERLTAAHARIYRTSVSEWDGRWHVVVLERDFDRNARARWAQALGYLGYGQLATDTWVAPRPSLELASTLTAAGAHWHGFTGILDDDPRGLAARVWDLDSLGRAYAVFTSSTRAGDGIDEPEAAFVARTELVHAWRLFLFRDPGLPDEVLPASWPGRDAAARFDERSHELMPRAREYVDQWLSATVAGITATDAG